MGIEIGEERALSLTVTNDSVDVFRTLIGKVAKKKMGFLKGELTDDEETLVTALDNYFKEQTTE